MTESTTQPMSKKIYIKDKKQVYGEFQFFMHDFVRICKESGFCPKPDVCPSYRYHIRSLLRRLSYGLYLLTHPILRRFPKNSALLIAADGSSMIDKAFPYYGRYEIVPMLWDVWPYSWKRMFDSLKILDVKVVLVSSKQVTDLINSKSAVKAFWIPEGIDETHYLSGKPLTERGIDVFEMGRQMPRYHSVLQSMRHKHLLKDVLTSNIRKDGTLDNKRVKYSNEEVYRIMADTKVMTCFPQIDTNPGRAGEIETLTQRYWESMLSRCMMVGRAPKELIDLVGYNPVVEVDWESPEEQLVNILAHINDYQQLVDRNRKTALEFAPWRKRMPMIKRILNEQGYSL